MELSYSDYKRIDSIFLPYTTKRKESFMAAGGQFVHYTSADNAMKIIRSKSFWMRNAKCMNDYMEVWHGYDLLLKFFSDPKRKQLFVKTLEPFGDNIANNALNRFDQWWNSIQFNTFIACISEHDPAEDAHGRLSMWRAYGQTSAKAAVILNIPSEPSSTEVLRLHMTPAAYFDYQAVEKELLDVIDNINNNREWLSSIESSLITELIFLMLVISAVSFKHEGFKEEREWRIIYLPELYSSELMLRSIETIQGVPQSVFKIPLKNSPSENVTGISIPELIDRVIIGPSEYAIPLHEAFKFAMEEEGIENANSKVIISGIPLRS